MCATRPRTRRPLIPACVLGRLQVLLDTAGVRDNASRAHLAVQKMAGAVPAVAHSTSAPAPMPTASDAKGDSKDPVLPLSMLKPLVTCSLCSNYMASCLVLTCSHQFCGNCLFEHLTAKAACPSCQVCDDAVPACRAGAQSALQQPPAGPGCARASASQRLNCGPLCPVQVPLRAIPMRCIAVDGIAEVGLLVGDGPAARPATSCRGL
jgi:hypothetical protein